MARGDRFLAIFGRRIAFTGPVPRVGRNDPGGIPALSNFPQSLGELRRSHKFSEERVKTRRVKDELRDNLMARLREPGPIFPGIVGYDDTVVPQLVNAILSRHNFILLGLRGQAKSRILRALTTLLDPELPYLAGCEIHDNPYAPLCSRCRQLLRENPDDAPIAYLNPDQRYVEKLATPDVTIADLIGDIDPIKAAKGGHELGSELTVHYGLLPRANRGIFAVNELPDLAGKIQVGLFNIMQEGDVQIKGYPVRLPLDVALVFTANPEDYTARGKIVTPLKDRIGSEIRTHYPATLQEGLAITAQEAWIERNGHQLQIPEFVCEVIEHIAFVAREIIRAAVARTYDRYFQGNSNMNQVVQWFDLGGEIQLRDSAGAHEVLQKLRGIQGLLDKLSALGLNGKEPSELLVSGAEFILEGLYAHKKIGRSEERMFTAGEKQPRREKQTFREEDEEREFRRQRRPFN